MKTKRATEGLNIELSRISAAVTIAAKTASALPAGEARNVLLASLMEANRGYTAAFQYLETILVHMSMI